MSCERHRDSISRYLDDALSPRERASLLEHIQSCPTCASTLARYRQMDVILRRLPGIAPSNSLRQRVLAGQTPPRRPLRSLPHVSLQVWGGGLLLAIVTIAVLFANVPRIGRDADLTKPSFSNSDSLAEARTASQPVSSDAASSREGTVYVSLNASDDAHPAPDDVIVLQQVRGTVRRPDFRPLQPAYLPRGARLDTVAFGRIQPTGPIDRLDMAFAASGDRIRVRQLAGSGAPTLPEARFRKRVIAGHEWVVKSGAWESGAATFVLEAQRDGMVISIESALPIEELERVAASLRD